MVYLVPNSESPQTSGPCDDKSTPTKEGLICKVTDQAGSTIPANAEVAQGSTVLYSVYKKNVVNVPYVVGLKFADAAASLQGVGLQAVQGKPVNTFDQPAGQVAIQKPKYNASAQVGSNVVLRLSTGKSKLPDVTKMKVDAARNELNRDQFTNIGPNPR